MDKEPGDEMNHFEFQKTKISGVYLIKPFFSEDNRGFFIKSFEKSIFKDNGLDFEVTEDFESISIYGVVRGLHFQLAKPQVKLVRCQFGEVFDVIVDLRKDSCTFGSWESFILNAENNNLLYIPAGFAHGFMSLSNTALLNYKCSGYYSKETDSGILWNDKQLGIAWPSIQPIAISKRDSELMTYSFFRKEYGGL